MVSAEAARKVDEHVSCVGAVSAVPILRPACSTTYHAANHSKATVRHKLVVSAGRLQDKQGLGKQGGLQWQKHGAVIGYVVIHMLRTFEAAKRAAMMRRWFSCVSCLRMTS